MPDPNNDQIPYLKTVVTLSAAILIYVFGEGELNEKLTIALVGLTLKNPEVLGFIIYMALLWFTMRFARKAIIEPEVSYYGETNDESIEYFKAYIERRSKYANRKKELKIDDGSESLSLDGLKITSEPADIEKLIAQQAPDVSKKIRGRMRKAKILFYRAWFLARVIYTFRWLLISDNFTHRYLPFFLAIFALWVGALNTLFY